jgi:hypothetical protein
MMNSAGKRGCGEIYGNGQKLGLRFDLELAPSFPLSGSLRKFLDDSALKSSNNA